MRYTDLAFRRKEQCCDLMLDPVASVRCRIADVY